MPLNPPYLIRLFLIGGLIGLIHAAYLYTFAAPLAEKLHNELVAEAEAEEEPATWAVAAVAFLVGGSLAYLTYIAVARGVDPLKAAAAGFVALGLLPTLKWLPTPHGVSYLEPVWWREAVHGLYIASNLAVIWAAHRAAKRLGAAAYLGAALGLTALFIAYPQFTLPEKYVPVIPELRALQGLALMGWAMYWALLGIAAKTFHPVRAEEAAEAQLRT